MHQTIIIPKPQYGKFNKYGFHKLEKYGDSILIETEDPHKVRIAAYKYAGYHGIKFVTRKDGLGVRVYHAGRADK